MENPTILLSPLRLPKSVTILVMNEPKSNRMRPFLKSQNSFSLSTISFICSFGGSALFLLALYLWVAFSGWHDYSDFSWKILMLLGLGVIFFIPAFLGIALLRGFLRYEHRKGWLTPKIGILSGIVVWGLGGIGFCFLYMVLNQIPLDQPLKMLASLKAHNYLTMILLGITIASLVGGWAGYVLSKEILFDQQFPLP
jgi:hypothetical protein